MAGPLLQIAAVHTEIISRDREALRLVEHRYRSFLGDGVPGWRIEIDERRCVSGAEYQDVVVTPLGRGRLDVHRHDFHATVDLRARRAEVALAEIHDVPLDAFLRVFYSMALLETSGLLLHAASLGRHDHAYVFPGRSGTGKTTVTRLSPTSVVLSDEIAAVRTGRDGALAYGTPFWGELARAGENEALPLAGIYFLHQASAHARESLDRVDAIAQILANALFFARDRGLTTRVLDVAANLATAVPCFRLDFRRDPHFWGVITDD